MKIIFNEYECELITSRYTADNSRAMLLVDIDDKSPICDVTVCLAACGVKPLEGNVYIKEYDCTGITQCMIDYGIIEPDPVCTVKHGFVSSNEYKLTAKGLSLW